ncbi:MAG TPA: carboxylating nicotinate-nucleotide diphosphorylase [Bacteroidia bacterium]|jgi:nicotinate-nucleotide pyrophosphorylase (carboxylating)|nr:carboxylating nicotinate-nucleotide diphosphorylase [Bacteroidia bacterium]
MHPYLKKHQKNFNFKKFVKEAFTEDVGDGDHTTLATLSRGKTGQMHLLVKEDGIIAGIEAAKMIFGQVNSKIKIQVKIKDGSVVKKGDIAFIVNGPTYQLLTAERLILNIMQRMSGIATQTARLQQLCAGTKAKVIDTRKTTPLFRFFEKWAVVIGGGANHRYALYDMVLIKDNHIDFAGGLMEAIDLTNLYLKRIKLKLRIEIECRNINDVKKVLKYGKVHRIMLDNFTPANAKKAVELIAGKYEVEASGGITERNIANYALAGVDFISVGALTHHVKSLDLSLKVIK